MNKWTEDGVLNTVCNLTLYHTSSPATVVYVTCRLSLGHSAGQHRKHASHCAEHRHVVSAAYRLQK